MNYEGQQFSGDQSQNSGTCHRGGITHDQVFTERNISRPAPRCKDDSVVVNGDIYLGDAPSAPQRQQVSRIERQDTYRNDDRNLDSRYSESQTRYGDSYTGSNSRMAEMQQQDYYRQQQQNEQYQRPYYEPQQRYGVNGNQLLGAGIGGIIGMAIAGGGHHGREGYYNHGNRGLGFLAGSMIGAAVTGGNGGYETPIMAQPMIGQGWGAPPPMYHYRHESQQQRYYEMQRERQQSQYYSYGGGNQGYRTYDNW